MGRTVTVEGQIAATTTSRHIARTIGADIRLKANKKVERKNFIKSDFLSKRRTENTKFDGGWVWKSDTLCGDPPPSKDDAEESLPGAFNGLVVNSYAEALPGEGAQSVYVEGMKVIRKDDKTFQNKRNSKGIIINEEDLAAYLAEPLKPDDPPPPPPAPVPTTPANPTANNQGTATPGAGNTGAAAGSTVGTNPTQDCSIISVEMRGPGDRVQSSDPRGEQPGTLWVNHSTNIVVRVIGDRCCSRHPEVKLGNDPAQKGFVTTWNPANVIRAAERIALALLVPGSGNLPPRPVETQLTVQSCKKQFNRRVMVMATESATISIGNRGTDWAGGTALLQRLPLIGKVIEEVKLFEGGIEFSLGWKEEEWWGGALSLTVTGQLTLIKVSLRDYTIPFWTAVPGGQLITLLTEIADYFNVTIVAGFTVGLSGALTLKSDLSLKLLYGSQRQFAAGGITGEATVTVKCGLTLKGGKAFDAFGGVEGTIGLSGEWKGEGWPAVEIKTYFQASIKAKLECTIGLGRWFSTSGKREFPLWESPKVELGKFTMFNAQAAIPSGGRA